MSVRTVSHSDRVRWFGDPWNRHVCVPSARVPVPLYEFCMQCERPILRRDQGLVIPPDEIIHLGCHLHSIGVLPCLPRFHPPTKETLS